MTLKFTCTTNKDYVRINTLKITKPHGAKLTVDRKYTSADFHDGKLYMIWDDCYLWALDGWNIFGDNGYEICDVYSVKEFKRLIQNAGLDFELEDDADEDYFVTIENMEVEA